MTASRAYHTSEDQLRLGEIDPELDAFLQANPQPQPAKYEYETFMKAAEARQAASIAALDQTATGTKVTQLKYETRDGHSIRALLFQPLEKPADGSPLLVLIHGGGFTFGIPESEALTCRNLVANFGAVAVSITYRLGPQYPYPAAPNDCWDALQWAAKNADSWGADPSKGFIVGGTSAGGNLSAVMAHKARDSGLSPPLTGQYLAVPSICPPSILPEKYKAMELAWEQNKGAAVIPRPVIDLFMECYKPNSQNSDYNVLANKHFRDLPRAAFQVDGMDPLRDEALIYDKILREENGIQTKVYVYPGVPHAHWRYFPMLQQSKVFRKEQVEAFSWLLGRQAHGDIAFD